MMRCVPKVKFNRINYNRKTQKENAKTTIIVLLQIDVASHCLVEEVTRFFLPTTG